MNIEVRKDLIWVLILIILLLILGGCQQYSSIPSARHGAKMIYDSVGKQVILFGGRGEGSITGDLYNDMWALDMETHRWQKINMSSGPSPRLSPGLVYDPAHHQLILFGGYSNQGRIKDTWLFDLPGSPTPSPSRRVLPRDPHRRPSAQSGDPALPGYCRPACEYDPDPLLLT